MGKVRLYALAKDLDVSSGDLVDVLKKQGHEGITASSSIDDDVAARLKRMVDAGEIARAHAVEPKPKVEVKKTPGKKAEPPPPPPVLPEAKPILRREKAVKPVRRADLSSDELAVAEERRRQRLARMRGEDAAPAGEAPIEVAAEEPVMEAAHAMPAEAAPVGVSEVAETVAPELVAAAEAEPAPSAQVAARPEEHAPAPRAPGLQLPHLVAPAPRPAALEPPPPPPQLAPPPPSAVPLTPTRPPREFRGPIRKIELPPQPPRPAPSYPRPTGPRPPGLGPSSGLPAGPQRTGIPAGQRPGPPGRTGGGIGSVGKGRKRDQVAVAPVVPVAPVKKGAGKVIRLTEGVTVKELAEKMEVKSKDIIQILMRRGMLVTVNVALSHEVAEQLAKEFDFKPEIVSFEQDLQMEEEEAALEAFVTKGDEEDFEAPRPPIVTVMGHVDHGKTSLLDAIRKTNVAAGEAGGITQSIGAYQVTVNERKVTFIDTPGHEAFTTMRSRGAQVTDLVILVVAASEGVMPQTVEAINHAKAAGVPVIIAINKVDLPNANPQRVKTDLMAHGLVTEEFGGEVVAVPVSATKKTGITELLEMVLLTADMRGLKGHPRRRALGTLLEAGIDRGKGVTANVIVQDGTLRPGDAFIAGAEYGRVRALYDAAGRKLDEAGPSVPVQITGLQGVPKAGDKFQVVEDESKAREISEFRQHKRREAELAKSGARGTLQDLSRAIAEGETKELSIVVKADVHGAVEVLVKSLADLSTAKVKTKIIHSGTGAITDSDVLLASASRAIIVGFNVRPERGAAELAEREKVIIRLHTVIYHLTEEMKQLMAGLLDAVREEEFLGRAQVRETFKVPKIGLVAGCYVQDGKIQRNAEARLVRDGVIVWSGRLASLKRFKEDAREVAAGLECGLGLEGFNDVKVGDVVECFVIREIRPTTLD